MGWQNDYDAEDVGCDPDEYCVVSHWHCNECNTAVEVYYATTKNHEVDDEQTVVIRTENGFEEFNVKENKND
jgi:hypothetical protein